MADLEANEATYERMCLVNDAVYSVKKLREGAELLRKGVMVPSQISAMLEAANIIEKLSDPAWIRDMPVVK